MEKGGGGGGGQACVEGEARHGVGRWLHSGGFTYMGSVMAIKSGLFLGILACTVTGGLLPRRDRCQWWLQFGITLPSK